jgi:hypothetical protein
MESYVRMSLKEYEYLRSRNAELEKALALAEERIKNLIPFVFTESGSENFLDLQFTDDAQEFLEKALEKYKDEYNLTPIKSLRIWRAARKKD